MRKLTKSTAAGLLLMLGLTHEANALPMFAKQTGMDCTSCHLQHIPKLNSMGRKFAVSGMTMTQKVADENNSAIDINPSIMFKSIYEKTTDKTYGLDHTETDWRPDDEILSIPRTASFLLGGRLSENIGGMIRLSYRDKDSKEDNSIAGKVVYAKEIESGHVGAVMYSSAYFGPFSGMEIYNTGLYKPIRGFDIKKLSNASQACGVGSGAATGFQAYYDGDKLFVDGDHVFGTVGLYAPIQDNAKMDIAGNELPFARVAYEYPMGGFNLIFGGFGIVGGSGVADDESMSIKRETYGVDFQVEGDIAEKSVSLVISDILRNKVTYTGIGSGVGKYSNVYNKAVSLEGEVALTPDFGVKLAWMKMDDLYSYPDHLSKVDINDIDHSVTVGFDYSFFAYLPMKLTVEHAWVSPSLDNMKNYRDFLVSLNILY